MSQNQFAIYQLKDSPETRSFRFEPLERLTQEGRVVDWGNYKHVYTGTLETKEKPAVVDMEKIFMRFNVDRPEDFAGHSLSTSDVVVLLRNGKAAAYYVDSFDYVEVPDFLEAPYKYYSTQRPVDIGTFPKTDSGPVCFINYDKREYVENATFRAWGYLAYDAPLTPKQMDDYELRAASGNPDNLRVSPYQLEAQLEAIGKWEKSRGLSDRARITWFHSDMGVYVKKDWVMYEQVADRFNDIVQTKSRVAEKREERKLFTAYCLQNAPVTPEVKRDMIVQAQLVGHWEEWKCLPENERFTWLKPSIQAFALREPIVNPEQLEQRYYQAINELNHESIKKPEKKPIAEQLAEAEKQVERGADAPTKNKDKSHEDR